MPRALITGITGQDGSYLAEFLLDKGYEVHGLIRPSSSPHRSRLAHLVHNERIYPSRLCLHPGDLTDPASLRRILVKVEPDELYHLASQSHSGLSFEMVESTCQVIAFGTLQLLEVLRDLPKQPRLFHASSSEVFGRPDTMPQDEQTPFRPATPYGCAKVFATQMAFVYRQNFGLFVSNGILFNHESPRRGEGFVTQKICRAAAAIKEGRQTELVLGNLGAERDWGDARDFVRGYWLSLQHERPEDFVFATGKLHSVQDVLEAAFGSVDLDWRAYVKQDPKLFRPDEPVRSLGNPAKAARLLDWQPASKFEELIAEMTREAHTPSSPALPPTDK